jgi:four helix bundle protein
VARILAKQLLLSGTSIGANVRESQFAHSNKDFFTQVRNCSRRSKRNTVLDRHID